jgi:hypothetical protein
MVNKNKVVNKLFFLYAEIIIDSIIPTHKAFRHPLLLSHA